MAASCRSWWRNCALEADSEILEIDRLEDRITPVSPETSRIRELISSLELCHHKAARWVENIVTSIGAGATEKGLGTRSSAGRSATERMWLDAGLEIGFPVVVSAPLVRSSYHSDEQSAYLAERLGRRKTTTP